MIFKDVAGLTSQGWLTRQGLAFVKLLEPKECTRFYRTQLTKD